MKYYSDTKRDAVKKFAGKWVELEITILSELASSVNGSSELFICVFKLEDL